MPQSIQPGLQMAWRILMSCSHSNQRPARTLSVPDSQGHLLWDLTLTGFNVRSALLWRSRIICTEEKTTVDRGEWWMVSALTQALFFLARTPSVTDPLPEPSLDIPTVFLSYPVLHSKSGQNQTSKFRCGPGSRKDLVQHGPKMPWTWLSASDFYPSLQGLW